MLALCVVLSLPLMAQQYAPTDERGHADRIKAQLARVQATTRAKRGSVMPYVATWESLAGYRTPEWFEDAKFGIFIHWGVYSVPASGNEWYSRNMYVPGNKAFEHHIATYGPQSTFGYKNFIPEFRAEKFNAADWVDLFVKAGARYVVPVGEHCDGFSMYASRINPWNASAMGPKRDVVGELGVASRARGLKFGVSSHTAEHWWWYGLGRTFDSDVRSMSSRAANGLPPTEMLYGPASSMNLPKADGSVDDSKEPDPSHLERWMPPNKAFVDEWLAKSTEIVDLYHPDLVYFDWWIGQPAFKPALQQFAAYYYDRAEARHEKPVLTYKEESMPANVATLDIERGKLGTLRLLPWQTDTSVSVHSWGYAEHDEYRTAKSLVQQLVDTVSKNGNLLLNVGPKSDGTIPDEVKTVLMGIGAWLKVNGESIYGSRPFPVFGEGPTKASKNSTEKNQDIQEYTPEDVRFTTGVTSSGEHVVYAILMGWPSGGNITIHTLFAGNPYLPSAVCRAELVGSGSKLTFDQQRDGLHVAMPHTATDAGLGDIAYVLRLHTDCAH
jgi:alpha-L-fucosidase